MTPVVASFADLEAEFTSYVTCATPPAKVKSHVALSDVS